MKNYTGFINDHSGSMAGHAEAACRDFNANIAATREAISTNQLDTVVSVVGVGIGPTGVQRQVVVSNPNILKPIDRWPTPGGTPLWDGIADMIELLKTMPDADSPDVNFLIIVTTDGEEAHSKKYNTAMLKQLIAEVSATGRWTFVFRAPASGRLDKIRSLGISDDNIQLWDTSHRDGLSNTTQVNTRAMRSFYQATAAGVAKSSSSFYANASKVDITALSDVSKDISLYVVPEADNGIEIRPFILRHRMRHLKGSAFYQLTKTEAKVQHDKQVLVRDRASGKFFAGAEARKMIGLPVGQNARLHPGDHKNFDLFIQSNSINRKLVGGTGVAYWEKIGVEFTAADLAYLGEKSPFYVPSAQAAAAPAVVQLPAVPVTYTPTKSPIPVTPRPAAQPAANDPGPVNEYFTTREASRFRCAELGIPQRDVHDNGPLSTKGKRWVLFGSLIRAAMERKGLLKKAA